MTKKKTKQQRSAIISDKAIRRWWLGLIVTLCLSIAAEFFMHPHPYFGFDGTTGFYAGFGFISCVAIVWVSKLLGIFLKRKEDYYQEDNA